MNNYERQTFVYGLLEKVYFEQAYSGITLNQELRKAPEGDRAFITKVFYGVIEKDQYLSYAIFYLTKSPPRPKIVLIMKIALYQLYFTEQKPYAVVSSAVDLCKDIGKKEVSGFVNATLKNFSKVVFPTKNNQTLYLTVFGNVPEWLSKKLIKQYGFDFALAITTAPLTDKTHIRYNPTKISRDEFEKLLPAVEKSSCGYYVTASEIENISDDLYTVQSLSSMLAVNFYIKGLKKGKVLDVCAAPGGKSVLMSQSGDFFVTACDLHPHRADLIIKYSERLGVKVTVVVSDATKLRDDFKSAFDLVVCDVPCSGIGVVKSKPDILLNRKEEDVAVLCASQQKILEVSSSYVKKGGRLCYSTCTVLYEENERVIERFLQKHPEYELENIDGDGGKLNLFSQIDSCDGFFVARMRRIL